MRCLFRATDSASAFWEKSKMSRRPRRHFLVLDRVSIRSIRVNSQMRHYQTGLAESRSLKGQNYYANFLLFIPVYALLLWPPASNTPVFMLPFITCTQWLFSDPFFSSPHLPLLSLFLSVKFKQPFCAIWQQINSLLIQCDEMLNENTISEVIFS